MSARAATPTFSVVRYGNVAAAAAASFPLASTCWPKELKSLPITDPRMTRFWITLDQAVDFVINCLCTHSAGGEIFIPKIPSVKIVDLAQAMAPGKPFEVIGIREGEKLHELMVGSDDARHTLDFPNYYCIIPELFYHNKNLLKRFTANKKYKALPENFAYTSDTNTEWLTVKDLKKSIKDLVHHEDY